MYFRTIMALTGLAALAGLPAASGEKQLTAREMFYTASAAAKPQPETAPAKPKPQPKVTKPKPQDTVAQTKSAVPDKVETATAPPVKPSKIVPVAYTQRVPLGVRYSVLKRTGAGESLEVDPGSVFRAGDRIRLSIEVNDTAYLYIVNRGSSGAWKVLFPSAEVEGGDNRVERGRRYEIPAGYVFTFDEQPGVEKLFLVLSRQPETDLENLIYSLSQRSAPAAAPARPPAVAPPEEKAEKILLAQNLRPIEDSLIGRLRTAYARDLIIERVDESTPGPKKEHAVYVVNATGRADSRVVVDITLNHQ
jgi:hypothetical protein